MEYLEEYGAFADVPLERMRELIREHYPAAYATYIKHGQVVLSS